MPFKTFATLVLVCALLVVDLKFARFSFLFYISVGKTTFLKRIANETLELQDLVEVVPEPIDKW